MESRCKRLHKPFFLDFIIPGTRPRVMMLGLEYRNCSIA